MRPSIVLLCFAATVYGADHPQAQDAAYYHDGDMAGSLKSDAPLPIFDADPQHLWNRLLAAFYVRHSELPSRRGGPPFKRIEGGDTVDFLAWGGSTYWSEPATCDRLNKLLDEFLKTGGERLITDPLKRTVLQHDLWAPFDFLIGKNIDRADDLATRKRRDDLCRKLATVIRSLALSAEAIADLPDNYAAAVRSGRFVAAHQFDPRVDYLPPRLLSDAGEWQEIDFYQPTLHEDLDGRFITLHTRNYRGRSYFRVFYRFPGGRKQLEDYLKYIEAEGIDWRTSAQNGFISLRDGLRQVPAGTEVALVQFMMVLDNQLRPTPTRLVESVRLRIFKNVDGASDLQTNTGVGTNVAEYLLKRRLLFDGLKHGGLQREPDDMPIYRVIFLGKAAPDWGTNGRLVTLARDRRSCHLGDGRAASQTMFSMINQGGFDGGAQLGVAHAIKVGEPSPRPKRAVKWKTADETYRRLVEYLER